MNNKLATLLKRADIWQSSTPQQPRHAIATSHTRLDEALHQGGWPTAALSEILCDQPGSGELQLLLPVARKLCAQGRQLIFISPPHLPYAPALQQAGIAPEQVLIIDPPTPADQLWAAEQTLLADVAAALLFWPQRTPDLTQLRKLQLAAQSTQGLSLLMRPCAAGHESSPAALRLRLVPTRTGCQLTIIKQRGGWAGQVVELNLAETLTEASIAPAELPVHTPIHALPLPLPPCRSDFSRDSGGKRNAWVATKVAPIDPTPPSTVFSRLH
ncbi:MAG: translesion DNA synthesis-associated protein ImuA [Gammaproteobacteria bacterium]|nr:translesion DNA synthesis-associated protein ImuA [Gammaproteobacteria bacterium]